MKAKNCRILAMLRGQGTHVSFHTPGHKRAGADITELSYSDNLLSPRGVIAQAEGEIAQILGARQSFIITDGATCGVHAMLCALRASGVRTVAFSVFSHKSVKEGCALLGLSTVEMEGRYQDAIPQQPTKEQLEEALSLADALLLTSPDYYGNFPPLAFAKTLCERERKPLVIDGAHGSHLHFSAEYAGNFAQMWVDSAHKSLPALTQGAVASAQGEWGEMLNDALQIFRTTSPSYPIMASVEYAVKYPRNEKIEALSREYKQKLGAVDNADWSKILLPFGKYCEYAEKTLAKKGIYPEFNDGNYLMFYLSPCTKERELKKLYRAVKDIPRGEIAQTLSQTRAFPKAERCEWVLLAHAEGRACAQACGLFPPCIPLVEQGERITAEHIAKLRSANSSFGVRSGKVLVYLEKE